MIITVVVEEFQSFYYYTLLQKWNSGYMDVFDPASILHTS